MLNQLIGVCGDDCGITSDIIDIPSFDCDPDSTTTVIYLARVVPLREIVTILYQ